MDFFINILKFLKDCLAAFLEFIVNFNVQEFLEICQKMFQKMLADPIAKPDLLMMLSSCVYSEFIERRMRRLRSENKEVPRKFIWMLWLSLILTFVGAYFFHRGYPKMSFCFFGGMAQLGALMRIISKNF